MGTHTQSNHPFPAYSDHQVGLLGGVLHREPGVFYGGYMGILGQHMQVRHTDDKLTQFTKGMELGGYYSREFLQNFEWNNAGSILLGWGEKRRTSADGASVYISSPKSRQIHVNTEFGYKFKHDKGEDGKTYFSLKPFGGLKMMHTKKHTHTEHSASQQGLTFMDKQYTVLDGYIGLGVRKRLKINDFSLKMTGVLEYTHNMKRPEHMISQIYLSNSTSPLNLTDNPYARNKIQFSFVSSLSHQTSLWKGFIRASIFKAQRTTGKQISLMLNRVF